MTPAFLPDGEFGAVAVETGHDENEGGGVRGGGGGGKLVVDWDFGAVAACGVGVGDFDFNDFVFTEAGWVCLVSGELSDRI